MVKREEKFLKIGENQYFVKFRGQGKSLFALHGFSENSSTWDRLEIQGFQVIAIDLLGHGQSSKPPEQSPYRMGNILADLHEIFEKLSGGQAFSLLGYSMGGRLALHYALTYPETRLEQLILESTGAGIKSGQERLERRISDEKLAQKILKNGSDWFADFWEKLSLFDSQKNLPKEVQEEIWQRRAENLPLALANTLGGTGQGELDYIGDKIGQIHVPILYISGALDKKYSQIAKEVFGIHKSVQFFNLPNIGHNVHLENHQEYQGIVENYLTNKMVK